MSVQLKNLKTLFREAEVYRAQGLLEQSRVTYRKLLEITEKSKPSDKRQKVIRAIRGRLRGVEKELSEMNDENSAPKLPTEVNSLIKKVFAFSKTKEAAAIEAAIALAKFGQYEQALEEFGTLLYNRESALVAAKNILRCHLSLASPEAAVEQFRKWAAGDYPLIKRHYKTLLSFCKALFKDMGVQRDLPGIPDKSDPVSGPDQTESDDIFVDAPQSDSPFSKDEMRHKPALKIDSNDSFFDISSLGGESIITETVDTEEGSKGALDDILDISSLKIRFQNGPLEGKSAELSVTFQVGNVVSVILPANKRAILKFFSPDTELSDIEIRSPITVFKGSGKVLGRTDIQNGPNTGDYMLDIIVYAS